MSEAISVRSKFFRRNWLLLLGSSLLVLLCLAFLGYRYFLLRKNLSVRNWLESVGGYVIHNHANGYRTPEFIRAYSPLREPLFDDITHLVLDSGSPRFPREHLSDLESLPSLKEIRFEITDLVDDDVIVIARLPHLTDLSVARSSVTEQCLPALAKSKSLRWINFSQCQIPIDSLSELRELHTLQTLYFWGNDWGDEEARKIFQMLPQLKTIILKSGNYHSRSDEKF